MAKLKTREIRCMTCSEVFTAVGRHKYRKICNDCNIRKELICTDCRQPFIYYGRSKALRCDDCERRSSSLGVMKARALSNSLVRIGVGSGGNQRGTSNHRWNPDSAYNGINRADCVAARGICQVIWPPECVICGNTGGRREAHHIDGNWRDCRVDNVIPLCVSCHKKVHRDAWPKTSENLINSLFSIWPEGRIKIAEKIGNPEMWESEVKARLNKWASRNDYWLKPETEYNANTRPRDTRVSKDSLSTCELF